MKVNINSYEISQSKVDNFRLACISDSHGDAKVLAKVREILTDLRPNYVAFPGDILDKSSQDKRALLEELRLMVKIAPIVASKGNHDIEDLLNGKWISKEDDEWIKKLHELDGFTLLDSPNNVCKVPESNVTFSAFNPDYDWYNVYREDIQQFYIEFTKSNFGERLDETDLNILLSHSPAGFVSNNEFVAGTMSEDIKLFDLILSGHYHGGLTPRFVQEILQNHKGIITPGPKYGLFPGGSYGTYQDENTTLIISNGLKRLPESTSVLSMFNGLYAPEIEIIDFTNDDKDKCKRKVSHNKAA